MPYAQTPGVQLGQLITESGPQILLESPPCFAWLRTASALWTCFCYSLDYIYCRLAFDSRKGETTTPIRLIALPQGDQKLPNT